MTARTHRGFTLLEILVVSVILGLVIGGAIVSQGGGMRSADLSSGYSAAIQNAQILLAVLQQDLRQLAVLPGAGFPVFPYSVALSAHGKSFTLRRSVDTTDLGSAFAVVTYQLHPVPAHPGLYHFVRSQTSPEGTALPDEQVEADSRQALTDLWLKDVKMDFMARFEADGRVRHFLELTLMTVADDRGRKIEDAPVYPVTNLFALPAPDPIETFAQDAYVEPPRNITGVLDNVPVQRGHGNEKPMATPPDILDGSTARDLVLPGDADATRAPPKVLSGLAQVPDAMRLWVYGVLVDLASTVGAGYTGKIVGDVLGDTGTNGEPAWREPFEIVLNPSSGSPAPNQIADTIDRMGKRGPEAVQRFLALFQMHAGLDQAKAMLKH